MPRAARSRQKGRKPPRRPAPERTDRTHRWRIFLVFCFFVLVFSGIVARLVWLQVDPDLRFSEEDLKHIAYVDIHRARGMILDRTGRVLASNRDVPSLSANPNEVDDPQALAQWLSRRLDVDEALALRRLTQRDREGLPMKFVWIKRYLTHPEVEALGDLAAAPDGGALMIQMEPLRSYPEGDLAAHILGFANREGQGSEGVELAYDKYLASRPGRKVSRVDNKRNFIGLLTLEYEPPTGGDDLVLTIDAAIQYTLEQRLDEAIEKNKAKGAMGILMDPKSGAILALAVRPAFDPNRYWDYAPELRTNRSLTDIFEPGSAFKIVTASGAIEQGLISPDDEIDCEGGSFNPYGHRISDAPGHHLEVVPFSQGFAQSSNIAIIKVAALLGPERLESWIRRFGFGQRSGVGLPGESRGIFRPRKRWSRLSMGSLPMGQEVGVTLFQLARAFSAVANGGLMVAPYVVASAVSKEGDITFQHEAPQPVRIMSEETAATMRALCHLVVSDRHSTGWRAAIPEYRVGGKTGTAQIARPDGGGYYRNRYTTIFAGFAPIADPKICAVIVVQEPMIPQHYGGYVCGPVFKSVVREALVRLRVPEDPMRAPGAEDSDGAELASEDADTVVARFVFDLLEPIEDGLDGLELLAFHGDSTGTTPTLPSFMGLTKREAKSKLVSLGLQWDPWGAGRVVGQDPPAGTLLDKVNVCRLVFSNTRPEERNDVKGTG